MTSSLCKIVPVSLVVAYRVEITVSSTVHASFFARSPPVHGTSRYLPDATGEIGGDASIFARRDTCRSPSRRRCAKRLRSVYRRARLATCASNRGDQRPRPAAPAPDWRGNPRRLGACSAASVAAVHAGKQPDRNTAARDCARGWNACSQAAQRRRSMLTPPRSQQSVKRGQPDADDNHTSARQGRHRVNSNEQTRVNSAEC